MRGYVYVLSNKSMPGLVKIGMTTANPEVRANQLYQTGVPTPFEVRGSVFSPDCAALERMAHDALSSRRVSGSREFFEYDASGALEVVEYLHREQMQDMVDEFLPDMVIQDRDLTVPEDWLRQTCSEIGEHPIFVVSAIRFIPKSVVREALEEFNAWAARRREKMGLGS